MIKSTLKYTFYGFAAFGFASMIFGGDDTLSTETASVVPTAQITETVVQKPKVEPVKVAEVYLPPLHQTCMESKESQPNAYKVGYFSTTKPTGKFGTYSDGEIWVEYDRYIWKKDSATGKVKKAGQAFGVNVLCTPEGKAY